MRKGDLERIRFFAFTNKECVLFAIVGLHRSLVRDGIPRREPVDQQENFSSTMFSSQYYTANEFLSALKVQEIYRKYQTNKATLDVHARCSRDTTTRIKQKLR